MSGVQRWEHRVDTFAPEGPKELLSRRSREGWELVAVTSATARASSHWYWKRPYVPEATP